MAGSFRKTVGILLLITALLISQIPPENASASSGDFKMNGNILVQYTGHDENVTIPSGVRVIGEDAFAGNLTLRTVTIPKDVEEIRYHAFSGCDLLTRVSIGDSVKTIGIAAFSDCKSLNDVMIGKGLKELGSGVFAGCPSLSNVRIESGSYHCKGGVIYDAKETKLICMLGGCSTTAYTMPASVVQMEPYAFWECAKLEYIALSGNMNAIPTNAFCGCNGLKAVSVPYSVQYIDAKAFAGCKNIVYAEIPSSVKWIHDTAFDGCFDMQALTEPGSVAHLYFAQKDISPASRTEYEEAVKTILEHAVVQTGTYSSPMPTTSPGASGTPAPSPVVNEPYYNPLESTENILGKTMIVSGDAVVFIDNTKQYVFQTGDTYTTYAENEGNVQTGVLTREDSEAGQMPEPDRPQGTLDDPYSDEEKGIYFPKYTVVGEHSIADQAYYGQTQLESYEFEYGIWEIGDYAFARSGLTEASLPDGLSEIGYGAFYRCQELTDVRIPKSVKRIGPYAFEGTPWLSEWRNASGSPYLIVGDGILLAYRGYTGKVEIPEGIRAIAPECFKGREEITSVVFPASLEEIGEEAFAGCVNLTSMSGGVNIAAIRDRAFYGCSLSTIRIGANVKEIGLKAFDCTKNVKDTNVAAVFFEGRTLPVLSTENTAGKLYNESFREPAFSGITVAIVPEEDTEIAGTVLDPQICGFRGLICCYNEDAAGGVQSGDVSVRGHGVTVLKCTASDLYPNASALPESVFVGGKEYPITRIREKAFSEYADALPDTGGSVGRVRADVISEFFEHEEYVFADLYGTKNDYRLKVTDDLRIRNKLLKAYEDLYGSSRNIRLCGFDITLEDACGIRITQTGKKNMLMTLPVPAGMKPENARVLCMDEDGQLESVASSLTEIDGTPCLQFYARHLAGYGIYTFLDDDGRQVSHGKLDASPDTGDRIRPKWFLCIGMGAAGIVLLLWKDKKYRRKKESADI